MSGEIERIYRENYSCYGVRKMWKSLRNEGESVGREHVARLMRQLQLRGAVRGKVKRVPGIRKEEIRTADLVNRDFSAPTPNRLWVADFTYVLTRAGWKYTAFVTDVYARRILGHAVSGTMNEQMVQEAFIRAVWTRIREGHGEELEELVHHNDRGSQYTADRFVELLAAHGIRASIGSTGDSYDNALAETINGAYKTELVRRFGPWADLEELRMETAKWVLWYNTKRINEYDDYLTPAKVEELWYSDGIDARKRTQSRT